MKRFLKIDYRERERRVNEKGKVLGRVTALILPLTLRVWRKNVVSHL